VLGAILVPLGAEPEYAELLASKPPLKRMGTPEEIAAAVVALLRNDYITGETLHVDGGQRLSRT
jgi:NAD(P)-dependent dehydrogenase (short-subunit alcohol dehydrogenase family)